MLDEVRRAHVVGAVVGDPATSSHRRTPWRRWCDRHACGGGRVVSRPTLRGRPRPSRAASPAAPGRGGGPSRSITCDSPLRGRGLALDGAFATAGSCRSVLVGAERVVGRRSHRTGGRSPHGGDDHRGSRSNARGFVHAGVATSTRVSGSRSHPQRNAVGAGHRRQPPPRPGPSRPSRRR
jgi:hypothetical protein